MPIAFILLVIGVIFIAGGVKNWSIPDLFIGKVKDRGNSGGNNPTSGTPPDVSTGTVGPTQGYASPVGPGYQYARIDQGVDVAQSNNYLALGAGVVERIATGWAGGTGQAVYVRLNKPVVVNGTTYNGYYVAEVAPLVKQGQRVQTGQPIAKGGSAELGFLINGEPTPLQGGLGAETQPTQAGNDFYTLIKKLLGQ